MLLLSLPFVIGIEDAALLWMPLSLVHISTGSKVMADVLELVFAFSLLK
jgi:hypothetical protein